MQLNDVFEVPLPVAEAWGRPHRHREDHALPARNLAPRGEHRRVPGRREGQSRALHRVVPRRRPIPTARRRRHRAVLKAEGGEIRGQGNGTALVTASLSPSPGGTRVELVTVLSIDGKLAQFAGDTLAVLSRGVIAEFAENLEFSVLAVPRTAVARRVEKIHTVTSDVWVPKRGEGIGDERGDADADHRGHPSCRTDRLHWLRLRWRAMVD